MKLIPLLITSGVALKSPSGQFGVRQMRIKSVQSNVPYLGRDSNSAVSMNDYLPFADKNNRIDYQNMNEECLVEPRLLAEIDSSKPLPKILVERALITGLASLGLAVILPPVKQLGLLGTMSFGHNIVRSVKAIAPIVAFTANMPALLGHLMQSIPEFKDLPENSKIKIAIKVAILATIKHFWVWPHENKLNTLSIGVGNSMLNQNPEYIRRLAHGLREAVLIMCVGQQACRGVKDQFLSYGNKALMQTTFDRIAFRTSINPMFTIASRGLYLFAVKEVIDRTSLCITKVMQQPK
ncbi:hypothetical protein CL647_07205 [bacterium]|nr:hypothetical protein [Actinomycetota bacterium]MBE33848.1 hypothetical protein [bacterium]|tara:strand:- start:902 stop:1786 length:885 start_codon:yes stop_codon:yes gene_type:complete